MDAIVGRRLRILLVEDHEVVRQGLKLLIEVGEAHGQTDDVCAMLAG